MTDESLTKKIVGYEKIYEHIVDRFGGDSAFEFFNHHERSVRQRIGDNLIKQMVVALVSAKNARQVSGRDHFYAQAMALSEAAAEVFEIPAVTDEQEDAGYLDVDLLRVADDAYMGDFTVTGSEIVNLVRQAVDDFQINGFQKEEVAIDG